MRGFHEVPRAAWGPLGQARRAPRPGSTLPTSRHRRRASRIWFRGRPFCDLDGSFLHPGPVFVNFFIYSCFRARVFSMGDMAAVTPEGLHATSTTSGYIDSPPISSSYPRQLSGTLK